MSQDADQGLRDVPRQSRVGVQSQDVAHRGEHGKIAEGYGEARGLRSTQQPIELLELPTLAFPAHEDALPGVPLPVAVKEVEGGARVASIERFDSRSRGGEDLVVTLHHTLRRVFEVAQDREVDAGVEVAQRLHFQVLE
ncbi:MAG: hypothetical protein ABI054_06955, partial [Planctomycetota bacterium]